MVEMRSGTLIRVMVGIALVFVLVVGVQAATPQIHAEREWSFSGNPWGIGVYNGWVFAADQNATGFIQKFDTLGNPIPWATNPADNWGLAVDKYGIVYTDGNTPTTIGLYVDKYDSNGNLVGSVVSTKLLGARGLAVDKDGNIYIAEWSTNKIRKYNSTGTELLSWVDRVTKMDCSLVLKALPLIKTVCLFM